MIYLASSGDEAKIWDASSLTLLEQFNPFDGSISDLKWSHDGNSIACCSSMNKTVHLRLTKTSHSIPSHSFQLPSACQCLDYSSASRYILCGCIDGGVHVWDKKTQAIKKSYQQHKSPVTVAQWNWNDTYIALGCDSGEIILYNVVTGQASSPLVAPAVQTIRQLKYNPYRKAALVSVSDDGAVNFWDTNTRRMLHSFTSTHQAPAKDLAFSPINDYLMVSVGLDKRAVFYDVQNKSPIKTIVAEQPLTSVDMMHDGATVVVGTTRGKIYVYDMRQSTTPVLNLSAHKSSVKRLSFIKKDDDKTDSFSTQSLRRQLPVTPSSSTDLNQNADNSNVDSPRNKGYQLGRDAFSPLGEVNRSNNSLHDNSVDRLLMQHFNRSHHGDAPDAGHGLFSPLRNDSHSINSVTNLSSVLGNNSFLHQVLGSAENSLNKEPFSRDNTGVVTPSQASVAAPMSEAGTAGGSPPRSLPTRGVGASPSFQQLSSPRIDNGTSSTSLPHTSSTPQYRTSPPRQTAPSSARSPPRHGVSFQEKPQIDGADAVNGIADTLSPRELHLRSEGTRHTDSTDVRNDREQRLDNVYSSPRSLSTVHRAVSSNHAGSPIRDSSAASTSSTSSASLRHLVQDILKEQLQEHREHLKSEIRAMIGHPGVGFSHSGTSEQQDADSLTSRNHPGMYQAEFIRNLICEELEDLKDFIHKEFWAVQVELIKQVFRLDKKMEAGFAECMINPILLDEIDRLREENARLKKTF